MCPVGLPKTIQIRDLDDDVYAALTGRSAEAGITVLDEQRGSWPDSGR
jgi:plasmid stability protein